MLAADRDRIARDLHDGVIQRLYATALKLRAGIRTTGDATGHGDEAVREIGDSIRDIRGAVFELERGRPASLRSDVLALAREYESVLGFVPVVRSRGPVDSLVGQELADQATVVLREALSNCARHAGAGPRRGRRGRSRLVHPLGHRRRARDVGLGAAGSGLRNLRTRAPPRGRARRAERRPTGHRAAVAGPPRGVGVLAAPAPRADPRLGSRHGHAEGRADRRGGTRRLAQARAGTACAVPGPRLRHGSAVRRRRRRGGGQVGHHPRVAIGARTSTSSWSPTMRLPR